MARSRPKRRTAASPDASLQVSAAGRRSPLIAVAAVFAAALAVRLNLALLYARAGRMAEARAVARQAAALDPGSPHVRKLIDDIGT
jgi:hypothetical protein